jgi:15-cis-phytoene synthase
MTLPGMPPPGGPEPASPQPDMAKAYAHAADLVARFDPDRHVAALFAPLERRPHLAAIHCFALEIGRVRASVSEAMPGEIRLQWWREALQGEREAEAAANPAASAVIHTIRTNDLPVKPFLDLIEARTFDLYDDVMPDWTTLEGYLGETQSSLIQLAAMVLRRGPSPETADAAGHAGVAIGLTGLLRAFPWHARRGQVFLPQSLLGAVGVSRDDVVAGRDGDQLRAALAEMTARVRQHRAQAAAALRKAPAEIRPAFLPLAMIETYLKRMERLDYAPFTDVIEAAQWKRIWRMWRWKAR